MAHLVQVISVEMGLYLLVGLLGGLVVKATLLRAPVLDFVSLAIPLGSALLTWALFLASILGLGLSDLSMLAIYAVVALALILGAGTLRRTSAPPRTAPVPTLASEMSRGTGPFSALVLGLVLALLVASSLLAVGRSYSSYDSAAGWAVKGYGIGLEGSVSAADRWGTWGRAYPLNLPLFIGLFGVYSGDVLPGSKLLFPLLFGSLLVGILRFWQRNHVGYPLAALGLLFLASNPLVFLHSTLGLANMPFGVYLTLGVLWLTEGFQRSDTRSSWVGGLLIAAACWTRAEGIAFALAVLMGLAFSTWALRQSRPRHLAWLIPIPLVAVPWFAFSGAAVSQSHLGSATAGFVGKLLAGQFNARYLVEILRLYFVRGIHPSNLGFLFPILALLLGLGLWGFLSRRNALATMLIISSVVTAAVPVLLFYVRSFTRWSDFTELLVRSFDRATLPAIFLTITTSILLFNSAWGPISTLQAEQDKSLKDSLPSQ